MKTLIVIDVQNDFVTGSLGTPEAQAIIPNVRKKIAEYRERKDKIIFTQDTHDSNYLETSEGKYLPVSHCIAGTDGWKIVDELSNDEDIIVYKSTFGNLYWSKLVSQRDDTIEIIGLCTDICVISNALILKAMFPNSKITVDASCCAGVTPETHKSAIEVKKICQIDIIGE